MKSGMKQDFKKALIHSIPIGIGYLPLGFVCGVFLQTAGLSPFQIGFMSLMVFGGSAQFIAASMIGTFASITSIVMAVFISNLRQMLYSSSLSIHVREKNIFKIIGIAQTCTDETYAVSYEQYEEGDWNDNNTLFLGVLAYFYWFLSNLLGGVLGNIIRIPEELASFTLISLFIALIILQINNKTKIIVGIVTIFVSLVVINFYKSNLNIIVISLIGASIGYMLEKRGGKNE